MSMTDTHRQEAFHGDGTYSVNLQRFTELFYPLMKALDADPDCGLTNAGANATFDADKVSFGCSYLTARGETITIAYSGDIVGGSMGGTLYSKGLVRVEAGGISQVCNTDEKAYQALGNTLRLNVPMAKLELFLANAGADEEITNWILDRKAPEAQTPERVMGLVHAPSALPA